MKKNTKKFVMLKSILLPIVISIILISIIQSAYVLGASEPPSPQIPSPKSGWNIAANLGGSIGSGITSGMILGGVVGGLVGCMAGPAGCAAGFALGLKVGGIAGGLAAPAYNFLNGILTDGTPMENIKSGAAVGAAAGAVTGAVAGGFVAYPALMAARAATPLARGATQPSIWSQILNNINSLPAAIDKIGWVKAVGGFKIVAPVASVLGISSAALVLSPKDGGVQKLAGSLFSAKPTATQTASKTSSNPAPVAPQTSIPFGNIRFRVSPNIYGLTKTPEKFIVTKWKVTCSGCGDDALVSEAGAGRTKSETGSTGTNTKSLIEKIKDEQKSQTTGGTSGGASGGSSAYLSTADSQHPVTDKSKTTTPATGLQKVTNAVKRAMRGAVSSFKSSSASAIPKHIDGPTVSTSIGPAELSGAAPPGITSATIPSLQGGQNTDPTVSASLPAGTGSSLANGGSGHGGPGIGAKVLAVNDVVECPEDASICPINPPQNGTVPMNFSINLKISTAKPSSCRYSQEGADFAFDSGTRFVDDVSSQLVTAHTDYLYNLDEGNYTLYYKCRDGNGIVSRLTHNFKVGNQSSIKVDITCTTIKQDNVDVCLNVTASDGADPGTKTIDVAITNDDQTVKIVRLGTEIQPPIEQSAPEQTGSVTWIIVLLILLGGVLGFLVWKYKHIENPEDGSEADSREGQLYPSSGTIGYLMGI